jgi:endoglucanase
LLQINIDLKTLQMIQKKFLIFVKPSVFIYISLLSISAHCQLNRTVFHEDFEKTLPNIQTIWTPTNSYSLDTASFSGKGLLFNSSNTTTNLTSSATISLTNLQGTTIALSASIKGESLITDGNTGMVIQLVTTLVSGSVKYYRIPIKTGTFSWEQIGKIFKLDDNIQSLSLNIGIYNATGKFWIDNLHIQVIAEPMPAPRTTPVVIDKTHSGMYRGMNVASTSVDPANIINKSSLDELSYDWKANTIRVMVGGEKYYPDGLLLANYDAVLQTELIRIDELVTWCTANGLKINLGLAGLSDGLFTSQAAQTRLINAWKLIAQRYKNTPTVWAYDLANEPVVSKQYPYDYTYPLDNTIMMWPTLAETLVNEIRVIDSVKSIIIESLNYGVDLDDIKPIDASVPNIIYSVHLYQPGKLTGQFGPETPVITYPGTIDGVYYDKAKLKQILAPLKAYQEKYRVPIYIGEFSCVRWAPSNSAYNYIRDCIEIFEEYNWDYDYYSFRTWNGWSAEHSAGYYDNVFPTTKTNRELLIRQYFALNQATSTIPGAPTIGTAISGNARATVNFTATANNGGSAIISYTATSSPGNFTTTGATSPLVVLGLTNGTAYTFTVKATNTIGTGVASSSSNSVIPVDPNVPQVAAPMPPNRLPSDVISIFGGTLPNSGRLMKPKK